VDYSRFDKIEDSDSDEEQQHESLAPNIEQRNEPQDTGMSEQELLMAQAGMTPAGKVTPKGTEGRLKFEHEGRTIYEWEQSLEEVNIYISPPPGVKAEHLEVVIEHLRLSIGLKGNPPFIQEETGGPVKVDESYWMLDESGELNINLQKMNKAETWVCALKGQQGSKVDPLTHQEIQKKMMLERFQEENPGFDFSGAEFNGMVPDPREFMGGVKYR